MIIGLDEMTRRCLRGDDNRTSELFNQVDLGARMRPIVRCETGQNEAL